MVWVAKQQALTTMSFVLICSLMTQRNPFCIEKPLHKFKKQIFTNNSLLSKLLFAFTSPHIKNLPGTFLKIDVRLHNWKFGSHLFMVEMKFFFGVFFFCLYFQADQANGKFTVDPVDSTWTMNSGGGEQVDDGFACLVFFFNF